MKSGAQIPKSARTEKKSARRFAASVQTYTKGTFQIKWRAEKNVRFTKKTPGISSQ